MEKKRIGDAWFIRFVGYAIFLLRLQPETKPTTGKTKE